MPTATPDVVVQGFGSAAVTVFSGAMGDVLSSLIALIVVQLATFLFVAVLVLRSLWRPR